MPPLTPTRRSFFARTSPSDHHHHHHPPAVSPVAIGGVSVGGRSPTVDSVDASTPLSNSSFASFLGGDDRDEDDDETFHSTISANSSSAPHRRSSSVRKLRDLFDSTAGQNQNTPPPNNNNNRRDTTDDDYDGRSSSGHSAPHPSSMARTPFGSSSSSVASSLSSSGGKTTKRRPRRTVRDGTGGDGEDNAPSRSTPTRFPVPPPPPPPPRRARGGGGGGRSSSAASSSSGVGKPSSPPPPPSRPTTTTDAGASPDASSSRSPGAPSPPRVRAMSWNTTFAAASATFAGASSSPATTAAATPPAKVGGRTTKTTATAAAASPSASSSASPAPRGPSPGRPRSGTRKGGGATTTRARSFGGFGSATASTATTTTATTTTFASPPPLTPKRGQRRPPPSTSASGGRRSWNSGVSPTMATNNGVGSIGGLRSPFPTSPAPAPQGNDRDAVVGSPTASAARNGRPPASPRRRRPDAEDPVAGNGDAALRPSDDEPSSGPSVRNDDSGGAASSMKVPTTMATPTPKPTPSVPDLASKLAEADPFGSDRDGNDQVEAARTPPGSPHRPRPRASRASGGGVPSSPAPTTEAAETGGGTERKRVATLESKFKSLLSTLRGYEDDELVSDLEGLLRKAEVCVARCQNRKRRAEADAEGEEEGARTTPAGGVGVNSVGGRAKRRGIRSGCNVGSRSGNDDDVDDEMEAKDEDDDNEEGATTGGVTRMTHDAKGHGNEHRSTNPRGVDSDEEEEDVVDDDARDVGGKFEGMTIQSPDGKPRRGDADDGTEEANVGMSRLDVDSDGDGPASAKTPNLTASAKRARARRTAAAAATPFDESPLERDATSFFPASAAVSSPDSAADAAAPSDAKGNGDDDSNSEAKAGSSSAAATRAKEEERTRWDDDDDVRCSSSASPPSSPSSSCKSERARLAAAAARAREERMSKESDVAGDDEGRDGEGDDGDDSNDVSQASFPSLPPGIDDDDDDSVFEEFMFTATRSDGDEEEKDEEGVATMEMGSCNAKAFDDALRHIHEKREQKKEEGQAQQHQQPEEGEGGGRQGSTQSGSNGGGFANNASSPQAAPPTVAAPKTGPGKMRRKSSRRGTPPSYPPSPGVPRSPLAPVQLPTNQPSAAFAPQPQPFGPVPPHHPGSASAPAAPMASANPGGGGGGVPVPPVGTSSASNTMPIFNVDLKSSARKGHHGGGHGVPGGPRRGSKAGKRAGPRAGGGGRPAGGGAVGGFAAATPSFPSSGPGTAADVADAAAEAAAQRRRSERPSATTAGLFRSSEPSTRPEAEDDKVSVIVRMGFSEEAARAALSANGWNLQASVESLLPVGGGSARGVAPTGGGGSGRGVAPDRESPIPMNIDDEASPPKAAAAPIPRGVAWPPPPPSQQPASNTTPKTAAKEAMAAAAARAAEEAAASNVQAAEAIKNLHFSAGGGFSPGSPSKTGKKSGGGAGAQRRRSTRVAAKERRFAQRSASVRGLGVAGAATETGVDNGAAAVAGSGFGDPPRRRSPIPEEESAAVPVNRPAPAPTAFNPPNEDAKKDDASSSSSSSSSVDYTGKKALVSSLRSEGRSLYIAKNYRDSVLRYTAAVGVQIRGKDEEGDDEILAVLHGNRAAALMMVGAFHAAAVDCDHALKCVNSQSGPIRAEGGVALRSKLLCRRGRAFLKTGKVNEAAASFEECLNVAKPALAQSKREPVVDMDGPQKAGGEKVLNQSITDATLASGEVRRFRDAIEGIRSSSSSTTRQRSQLQTLLDINSALTTAPGDLSLHQRKVNLLMVMKRWTELAEHCERLACEVAKFDGLFTEDLESLNPFPGIPVGKHLSPTFFDDTQELEEESVGGKILSAKMVAEAVLRLPYPIIPSYLRALRLEERYTEAARAGAALEMYANNQSPTLTPSLSNLKAQFAWLGTERDKLRRTMSSKDRGDALFRNGDYARAAAKYASCLTIDSEGGDDPTMVNADPLDATNAGGRLHAILHCNRAACLMALRQYRDATKECTAALRIHPLYMKAMLRRGRCFARLDRFEESVAEYERWINLVEEARREPAGCKVKSGECLFDRAADIADEDYAKVKKELVDVRKQLQDAAVHAKEEAEFRNERQRWYNDYSRRSSTSNGGTSGDAYSRRNNWYNQQGNDSSRRWDSFNGTSPKKHSSRGRAGRQSSSGYNSGGAGNGDGGGRYNSRRGQEQQENRRENPRHNHPPPPRGEELSSSSSSSSPNHYKILEVRVTSSQTEIKKAYHKLALKYHPDKNKGCTNAADTFRRVKAAYETLSDGSARRKYDAELRLRQYYY